MKLGKRQRKVTINQHLIRLKRNSQGVVVMKAQDDMGLAAAMGFCHGMDRMLQMLLVRLVGQGRLSECLQCSEDSIAIDRFARSLGFAREAAKELPLLSDATRAYAQNYCDGFNFYLSKYGYPWEYKLLGYKPEPWKVEDILLMFKVMSYIGLAQSQEDAEKFVIQCLQQDVDQHKLKALFSPHLNEMDDELTPILKQIKLEQALLPTELKFLQVLPKVMASNNWVLAGSKTESGKAIQCNDPHLEVNRLPCIWYEFIAHTHDDYRIGVNMPGVPGMIMGRTSKVSAGFTYGFMDMIDFFVEEVKDGKARRGDSFEPLEQHREQVHCKKGRDIQVNIWESSTGILEAPDDTPELEDGFYLSRAWSGHKNGSAEGLNAIYDWLFAENTEQAQTILARATVSCNWLIADTEGNIGYQQSGILPRRVHSGLYPLAAWNRDNHWQGLIPPEELGRISNPECGYIATANNDLNHTGKHMSINLPMGSYRADRIDSVLREDTRFSIDYMQQLQSDLYSTQAELMQPLFLPFCPDNEVARILQDWDLNYDKHSKGASLFEALYHSLLKKVFGDHFLGQDVWDHLIQHSNIMVDFYHIFDRALLDERSIWFQEVSREELIKQCCDEVFEQYRSADQLPTWGEQRQIVMNNILFDGKLPGWTGFDIGPFALEGNRATIVQGAIYESHGRMSTFAPSWRYITDMSTGECHTALAGGVSDRRFSSLYSNGIEDWLNYRYKKLSAD